MTDKRASGGHRGRWRTPDAGRTDAGEPNRWRAGKNGPGNRGPGADTGEKPSQVCGPRAAAEAVANGADGGEGKRKKITRRNAPPPGRVRADVANESRGSGGGHACSYENRVSAVTPSPTADLIASSDGGLLTFYSSRRADSWQKITTPPPPI